MKQMRLAILLLIAIALILDANADYISLSVDTNSSHWSIYRQSINLSLNLSSLVKGTVSPVEYNGRILSPYQSSYEEIGCNDVRVRQRTSALEGNYESSDKIEMQSLVNPNDVEISINKPSGTDIYTIEYKNEFWPVILIENRSLTYSGKQINDRDFEGNNGDFVGTNFLYNHELSKEQRSAILLLRANATVLATDNAILSAEFKPTKYLGTLIQAKTDGIADLSYMQRDTRYDTKHQIYPAITEDEERYYGRYDLARKIEMRSIFKQSNDTDEDYVGDSWLPCCNGGWYDMNLSDKNGFGTSAKGIFDCTCYNGALI